MTVGGFVSGLLEPLTREKVIDRKLDPEKVEKFLWSIHDDKRWKNFQQHRKQVAGCPSSDLDVNVRVYNVEEGLKYVVDVTEEVQDRFRMPETIVDRVLDRLPTGTVRNQLTAIHSEDGYKMVTT